jgi:membrane protease YdiL (CAAX protease family)
LTVESPIASDTRTRAPWSRAERRRLALWMLIAFPPPFAIALAFHLVGKHSDSMMSVRTDLPFRALAVFFVALATWVVSRMEKRPLADYGIPVRPVPGLRFWEGTVWGFAMLSAVLLILYASGHFRIDSVALAGKAALRGAVGWGAVLLAVALSEELSFRGYLLFIAARRIWGITERTCLAFCKWLRSAYFFA